MGNLVTFYDPIGPDWGPFRTPPEMLRLVRDLDGVKCPLEGILAELVREAEIYGSRIDLFAEVEEGIAYSDDRSSTVLISYRKC